MSKSILNIKTDREVKDQARQIAEEIGVPLSTVVNAFLKEFIRNRQVTFTAYPTIKSGIGKLLKQASVDYRRGENISEQMHSAREASKFLNTV